MAEKKEKKGLFSGVFSNNCCDIRIEEVPEEKATKSAQQEKQNSGGCCCWGVPDGFDVVQVGRDKVDIVGYEEIMDGVRQLGLTDQDKIKDELLKRAGQRNYIAPGSEEVYREALWQEYCLNYNVS